MKKRIFSLLLLLLCTVLLITACGSADSAGGDKGNLEDNRSPGMSETTTTTFSDRKLIKTVNETVETDRYEDFIEALKQAVSTHDGYFDSSRYTGDDRDALKNRSASFVIRIPAERLDQFTASVGTLGTVTYHQEKMDDVTLSYVDVESRIGVLEAKETSLTAMLGACETVADMLAVEKSLTEVQGELASLKAQKASYDNLIAYSTVHMDVREVDREKAVHAQPSFFHEVGETFVDNLYGIGGFFRDFAVWFLGNSLVLAILAAVAMLIFFVARRIIRFMAQKSDARYMEYQRHLQEEKAKMSSNDGSENAKRE